MSLRPFWTMRLLALAFLASLAGASARADLVVTTQNVTTLQGTTGNYFDILVSSDTNNSPFDYLVGGFSVEVEVNDMAGITFTGASDVGDVEYVFNGIPALGFGVQSNSGFNIVFDDLTASPSDYREMSSADAPQTFLLGRVFYDVANDAAIDTYVLNIHLSTDVSDPSGDSLNPSLVDGSIRISPRGVPEPSSALLIAIGAGGVGLAIAHRRRLQAGSPRNGSTTG